MTSAAPLPAPGHPQVRTCLLEEAKQRFKHVKQVPLSAVPAALRLEYVDVWELRHAKPAATLPAG